MTIYQLTNQRGGNATSGCFHRYAVRGFAGVACLCLPLPTRRYDSREDVASAEMNVHANDEDLSVGAGGSIQDWMPRGAFGSVTDGALQSWLSRGLHCALDAVIGEALPPDFLRILDAADGADEALNTD